MTPPPFWRSPIGLRVCVWLLWLLIYGAMLLASSAPLFEGTVLAWGSPGLQTMARFGAALPPAVHAGQWQRVVLSPWLHDSLLGFVLLSLFWWSLSRSLVSWAGVARTLVVFVLAGTTGALAHVWAHPDARILGAGPFDALLGLLGAQWALGWRRGGEEGRLARRAALGSLISIGLLMALLWYLTAEGRSSTLRALFGVEAALGGLLGGTVAGLLLAPRVARAPRWVLALASALGLCVLTLVGVQCVSALTAPKVELVEQFLGSLQGAEAKALQLLRTPRRATPQARQELGQQLDALAAHPCLTEYAGAETARTYLAAMRPIATGDVRLPYVVEAELKRSFRAWVDGYETTLRAEAGLSPTRRQPWDSP